MAKRRLKKIEKIEIVRGLLKKLNAARQQELIDKQQALGLEIYDALFAETEKKILDAMGGMSNAKQYLRRVTRVEIRCVEKDGKSLSNNGYKTVDVPHLSAQDPERPSRTDILIRGSDDVELPSARILLVPDHHNYTLTLKAPKKFWKRIQQLQLELQEHEKAFYEARDNLAGVVAGCTFVEQLLELFPEAEEFVPAPDAPVLAMVPVGTIDKLRKQLRQADNNTA